MQRLKIIRILNEIKRLLYKKIVYVPTYFILIKLIFHTFLNYPTVCYITIFNLFKNKYLILIDLTSLSSNIKPIFIFIIINNNFNSYRVLLQDYILYNILYIRKKKDINHFP